MSPKMTAVVALVVTAVIAAVLGCVTATPELMSLLITGGMAIVVTGFVLFTLFRLPWVHTLAKSRQTFAIWTVAALTSLGVCCVPLLIFLFRH